MQLQLVPSHDKSQLTALLQDAEEDNARIVQSIDDSANTAYILVDGNVHVGALVMSWQPDESEILYIAIDETLRGRGYGKIAITRIITEAKMRGVLSVIVGTANSSLDNIAFYQKCGFRLDTVRKDYFSYVTEPVYEYGILMQDMVMLRFELSAVQ